MPGLEYRKKEANHAILTVYILYINSCTHFIHIAVCSMKEYIYIHMYLVDKLDGVLEDREETRQTEVGHFLHHWIRIHLETPATSSPVV